MIKQLATRIVQRFSREPRRPSGSPFKVSERSRAAEVRPWMVGLLVAAVSLLPNAGSADLSGLLAALDASNRALETAPSRTDARAKRLPDSLQPVGAPAKQPTPGASLAGGPWPNELHRFPSVGYVPRDVTGMYLAMGGTPAAAPARPHSPAHKAAAPTSPKPPVPVDPMSEIMRDVVRAGYEATPVQSRSLAQVVVEPPVQKLEEVVKAALADGQAQANAPAKAVAEPPVQPVPTAAKPAAIGAPEQAKAPVKPVVEPTVQPVPEGAKPPLPGTAAQAKTLPKAVVETAVQRTVEVVIAALSGGSNQAKAPAKPVVEPPVQTLPEVVKAALPKVSAQEPKVVVAEPVVQTASEIVKATVPAVKGNPRSALDNTVCSLNVADWDLSKVLQALSVQTQANLLLQAPVNTKLTINLTNVPLIDMLRHITAVTNLSFIKVENTYVIAEAERLAKGYPVEWNEAHPGAGPVEPVKTAVMTRVYISNYVKASQIAEALKAMFESQGLAVSGGPSQVSPKIEVRDTVAVTGISTGSVASTNASAADGLSRVVILRGKEDVVEAALEVAKSLDMARAQVAIAVSIHDITNEAVKELGMSWTFGDVSITESQGNGVNFGAFTRAPQSFSAAIKALEKTDKAKLLASPNVSVLDGEQAFILIGNRINYPVLIGYTQLNTPIFDKETEKVGIYLQVAASVSSDNSITLNLYPQVSTVTGFLQVNGASYPQIATREAQTTLRVANGETIVMGGLLRDEEIANMEKVPLLGDIPILGELFKRRKKTKTSSQVLIAITPVVIQAKD